jgi:pentatricopeptide repeat protein
MALRQFAYQTRPLFVTSPLLRSTPSSSLFTPNHFNFSRAFSTTTTTTTPPTTSSFDLKSFHSDIVSLGKNGQFNEIWSSYHAALKSGLEPKLDTFNLLLKVYGQNKQKTRLREVFDEMQRHQVNPNAYSLIVLTAAFEDNLY